MGDAQIGHVDPEFVQKFSDSLSLARHILGNRKGHQYIFTGTGTVGMEAAVACSVQPGDSVLVVNSGYFGHRFTEINEAYGAHVEELTTPFGFHADPDEVRKALATAKFSTVFVTHVDTGSTICNPIKEIVETAKASGVTTVVVDGVCSVGGISLNFDGLGADFVFTGSQKALAAPPGAVLIAVSAGFQDRLESRRGKIHGYYSNLLRWKQVMDNPATYFATHAVQVLLALRQALSEVRDEGLEERWKRHDQVAAIVRDSGVECGLKVVAEEGSDGKYRASTVSGFWTAEGSAPAIQKELRETHGIDIARGLGDSSTKMLRVGHLGNLTPEQARYFAESLRASVEKTTVAK